MNPPAIAPSASLFPIVGVVEKQDFSGQDLSGQKLRGEYRFCNFDRANMTNVDAEGVNFLGSTFRNTNLRFANFRNASLRYIVFEPADAYGICFSMTCDTFRDMGISRLWWYCFIYFAAIMDPVKKPGEMDLRKHLIGFIGADRYTKLSQMFMREV